MQGWIPWKRRWLSSFLLVTSLGRCQVRGDVRNYTYTDLAPCTLNTRQLAQLGASDNVEPCILYHVDPRNEDKSSKNSDENHSMFTIDIVQVTPSSCENHRDGALTSVETLNGDNGGRGFSVGFTSQHFVRFALTSVVAGNRANLTQEEYDRRHVQLLRSLLEVKQAPYIVGTCSFAAAVEKQVAAEFQAILMAQVGPPGFYANTNPHVFGFHVNSGTYPLVNIRSLEFLAQKETGGAPQIPIRVIYRTKSEFFHSTCQSAIEHLAESGFTDMRAIGFDPEEDFDGNGVTNQFDKDFLVSLADEACPPNADQSFHPALFVCTLAEQDILIQRWGDNGCRPVSIWMAASTWGWADNNLDKVPYYQGGGQWHERFDFSDKYFTSGREVLFQNEQRFGYHGTYDQLVSYAIPQLFAQHLINSYRVADTPNPIADFASVVGRESLRRDMVVLKADTIFGPVVFNDFQQNVGRGAAGTQWLPLNEGGTYVNALIAPLLQAEASPHVPAPSALPCSAGDYVDNSIRLETNAVLTCGCVGCPQDTFTSTASHSTECMPCPFGGTTDGLTGQDRCFIYDDNLLSPGIVALGYTATLVTWCLAIGFLTWLFRYRNDPVVKVSQIEFMVLICVGAMISSGTVVALSLQAGTDEDTTAASWGCTAAPFLYSIGWVLQYSSLSAKTYRLFQTMVNTRLLKREAVTFFHMLRIVVACLVVDLIIVTIWTIHSPLTYERSEESVEFNPETGIVTIDSVGRCVPSQGDFWRYLGPLLGFHAVLVVCTNSLLYQVRDIDERYQEHKYVALASAFMVEALVVGIPVVISVNDSAEATFIVLTAMIAMADIAVLSFIFVPKIGFQRKGLEEGVGIGESILRESHRRAAFRENVRRSSANQVDSGMPVRAEDWSSPLDTTSAAGNGVSPILMELPLKMSEHNSKETVGDGSKKGDSAAESVEGTLTALSRTNATFSEREDDRSCEEDRATRTGGLYVSIEDDLSEVPQHLDCSPNCMEHIQPMVEGSPAMISTIVHAHRRFGLTVSVVSSLDANKRESDELGEVLPFKVSVELLKGEAEGTIHGESQGLSSG